ncbi:hypothetical protein [Salibacterium salarium]|nr:hypothetical protein [Salibacterium salarium]
MFGWCAKCDDELDACFSVAGEDEFGNLIYYFGDCSIIHDLNGEP